MILNLSSEHLIESLRKQFRQWETLHREGAESISSGCPALDQILPQRGFHRGAVVEFIGDSGSGAASLALIAARQAGRELIVIDRERTFYPPAWEADAIFVHPQDKTEELWSIHQALGCKGVGAVLAWPIALNGRVFRAFQLAAERGETLGVFVRPTKVRGLPTWAEIQLLVEAVPHQGYRSQDYWSQGHWSQGHWSQGHWSQGYPLQNPQSSQGHPSRYGNRRMKVTVIRCRNGKSGASIELELDDETQQLSRVAPQLAAAKIVRQPVA